MDADGNRYNSPYVNVSGYSGGAYNGSVVSKAEGVSPYKTFGFNVLDALGDDKHQITQCQHPPVCQFSTIPEDV